MMSRKLFATALPLLIFVVTVLLLGCGPKTTWSAEAKSPDGLWLATAQSEQWSGPGNASDGTFVYLRWTKGSEPQTEILAFDHQYATMNLNMKWLTPTHLDVSYGPSARLGDQINLDFQVVKMGGITITTHEF